MLKKYILHWESTFTSLLHVRWYMVLDFWYEKEIVEVVRPTSLICDRLVGTKILLFATMAIITRGIKLLWLFSSLFLLEHI